MKKTYAEKLKDPRWQKKRLKILERDEFACQICFNNESALHVHHLIYKNDCDPWNYNDDELICLCESCHLEEKEHLPRAARGLINALKIKFKNSGNLIDLGSMFYSIELPHTPDVFVSALSWFMRQESNLKMIVDIYMESLISGRKKDRK